MAKSVQEQTWTNADVFQSRNMFPRTGVWVSICVPESDAFFLFEYIATSFHVVNESRVEHFSERFFGLDTVGGRLRFIETGCRASLDFAITRSSSPPCFPSRICLFDMA